MTIVVTGGGSGGHITPLLAVASEIKKLQPDTRIIYIGQRGDRFGKVVADYESVDAARYIFAGKFRRYHGEGLKQLLDIKTMLLNLRDVFFVAIGLFQSLWLLARLKPSAVFIKGGFVGVPVGLAAAAHHVPYMTHDSDALAGLANRIVARWASKHAVALPKETYDYPPEKTVTVGVPVSGEHVLVTDKKKQEYRAELGLNNAKQVLLVTGGGLGAQIINESIVMIAPRLLEKYPDLYILHTVGRTQYDTIVHAYATALPAVMEPRLVAIEYVTDFYRYSGAADVVVTRAGASSIAEMAAQGKACILVPNPLLTGGHQVKNASAYASAGAVEVLEESVLRSTPEKLLEYVSVLLESPERQQELGRKLHTFTHENSTHELAELILEEAKKK